MILQPVWDYIQSHIFEIPTRPGLFNFYASEDAGYDCPGAARLRQENLHAYLESFLCLPTWLLVGEAPGWKGCRFSGVPFTCEAQLAASHRDGPPLPFYGRPTSQSGQRLSEASATVFWETLRPRHPDFLVWNCVPLHPHRRDEPMSNRTPVPAEIRAFAPVLAGLVAVLDPVIVIAIGRKAGLALQQAGLAARCVRHPGHGGKRQFQQEIRACLAPAG